MLTRTSLKSKLMLSQKLGGFVKKSGTGISALSEITDGTTLIQAMGFGNLPVNVWKGNEASNCTDLQGSDDLTETGTPTRSVSNAAFDQDVTTFDSNSTDSLTGGVDVCEPPADSFAMLWVGEIKGTLSGKSLMGIRDPSAPNYGWEMRTSSSATLRFLYATATGTHNRDITISASTGIILGVLDYSTNVFGMYSTFGDSTGGVLAATALDNAVAFEIGAQRSNSLNQDFALAAWWSGNNAEGLNKSHVTNLQTSLGL